MNRRNHRALRATALVVTAVFAFTGTAVAMVNHDFQKALNAQEIDGLLGTDRPTLVVDPDDPYAGEQINILVMGTDLRDAENIKIAGAADTMASDTTLLVHISGDRTRAEVVSIPRDSMVAIPSCVTSEGVTTAPHAKAMFNAAFAIGAGPNHDLTSAAACTVKTVESLTGVRITSHIVLKMNGVVDVVDALGGVKMCLPEAVIENKKYGNLNLPAGEVLLDGTDSIGFLRARKGTGMGLEMGSDLTRITRQQAFLNAAADQILSQNLITNSLELYATVKAMLGAMSTSPDLASPASLVGLAYSLRSINLSNVTFTSVPVGQDPSDKYRVVWTGEAAEVWDRIIHDSPVPGTPAATPKKKATAAPDAGTNKATDEATDPATKAPTTTAPATEEPTEPARAGVC